MQGLRGRASSAVRAQAEPGTEVKDSFQLFHTANRRCNFLGETRSKNFNRVRSGSFYFRLSREGGKRLCNKTPFLSGVFFQRWSSSLFRVKCQTRKTAAPRRATASEIRVTTPKGVSSDVTIRMSGSAANMLALSTPAPDSARKDSPRPARTPAQCRVRLGS